MSDKKHEYKVLSPVSVSAKAMAKDAQIGDVVELTETQAKNRVNKVKLLSDWEAEQEIKNENSATATARKEAEREKLQEEIAERNKTQATEIAKTEQAIENAKTDLDDETPNYDED